ncbi:MAG: hypothetical protein AAF567_10475 [Actinomycetota bacterium]
MTIEMTDAPDLTPGDYEALSAQEKFDWLNDQVLCGTEYHPVERPELTMAKPWTMASVAAFPRKLARTFDRTEDRMEDGRPKIIHAQGAVAMVEFRTDASSTYTGVLAPPPRGGALGLVRISLAVPPIGKGSITPGLGLKLLVDGAPSLDVLAMNHTVGQGRDFNLFANTFTHDLRNEHKELRPPQKVMSFFFGRASREPRRLVIDHLAGIESTGTVVAEPRVPERLVFSPHAGVRRSVYAGAQGEDFRDPLMRIEPGTVLWEVMATDAGKIGEIVTRTRFCCSAGGDRLFFRHNVAPEDRLV